MDLTDKYLLSHEVQCTHPALNSCLLDNLHVRVSYSNIFLTFILAGVSIAKGNTTPKLAEAHSGGGQDAFYF